MSFSALRILNSVGLAFVFFDEHANPLCLSNGARRILHMESGDILERDADHLQPLVSLAEAALRKSKGLVLEGSPTLS